MGQSQLTRAQGAADTVITNALILDHSGIYKADIALRGGRIAAIGKAGNPDIQPGSRSSSDRGPKSSPGQARSSPPAASTRISTSSARSTSRKPPPLERKNDVEGKRG